MLYDINEFFILLNNKKDTVIFLKQELQINNIFFQDIFKENQFSLELIFTYAENFVNLAKKGFDLNTLQNIAKRKDQILKFILENTEDFILFHNKGFTLELFNTTSGENFFKSSFYSLKQLIEILPPEIIQEYSRQIKKLLDAGKIKSLKEILVLINIYNMYIKLNIPQKKPSVNLQNIDKQQFQEVINDLFEFAINLDSTIFQDFKNKLNRSIVTSMIKFKELYKNTTIAINFLKSDETKIEYFKDDKIIDFIKDNNIDIKIYTKFLNNIVSKDNFNYAKLSIEENIIKLSKQNKTITLDKFLKFVTKNTKIFNTWYYNQDLIHTMLKEGINFEYIASIINKNLVNAFKLFIHLQKDYALYSEANQEIYYLFKVPFYKNILAELLGNPNTTQKDIETIIDNPKEFKEKHARNFLKTSCVAMFTQAKYEEKKEKPYLPQEIGEMIGEHLNINDIKSVIEVNKGSWIAYLEKKREKESIPAQGSNLNV